MKKKFIITSLAIVTFSLGFIIVTLTSCSNNDDNASTSKAEINSLKPLRTQLTARDTNSSKSTLKNIRHLDYVILICDNPDKIIRFYTEIFGFEVYRKLPMRNWTELRVGSVLLAIRPRREGEGTHQPGSVAVQLAFRVTPQQVNECFEELKQKGVKIQEGPKDQEWGHRTLFFRDPENNLLEIYADI